MPPNRAVLEQAALAATEIVRRRSSGLAQYRPNNKKYWEWQVSMFILRVILGGNRTGKTETGGVDAVCAALGSDIIPYTDFWSEEDKAIADKWAVIGASSGWVCSVSYKLQPAGCQEKILHYLPESEIADISYLRKVENIISQIILKNGKTITFKSYEQGRKDFQSAGIGWIWYDEEPPKDIWQEGSMRQSAGVTLYRWLTMTPVEGMTWVYHDLYIPWREGRLPSMQLIEVGWDDNPHLTESQKAQMAEGLTADELEVRKSGKFVRPSGSVYKEWNLANYKPIAYDPYLPLHVTWDFGVNDPTVMIWIQPNGGEYRVIDYYEATDVDIGHYVQVLNSKPYKTPELHTGDIAGNARNLTTGTSPIEELAKKGIHVRTKHIANLPDQIREAHKYIRGLYVDSNLCKRFKDCLISYRYPKKSDAAVNQSNEIPVHDEYSHAMRAFEYWCVNYADVPSSSQNAEAMLARQRNATVYDSDIGI